MIDPYMYENFNEYMLACEREGMTADQTLDEWFKTQGEQVIVNIEGDYTIDVLKHQIRALETTTRALAQELEEQRRTFNRERQDVWQYISDLQKENKK